MDEGGPRAGWLKTTLLWNPFFLLYQITDQMISPRRTPLAAIPQLVICCAVLLAASAYLMGMSVRLIRPVALRRAMGEPALLDRLRHRRFEETPAQKKSTRKLRSEIRRVVGPPMVWKEMTCTLSRRERFAMTIALAIEGLLIVIAYSFSTLMAFLDYGAAHIMYVWAFLGLAILFTITSSATVMSVERESRPWPVLLMTPLTDREILIAKFVGVLRRCGPIWLALLAYVAAFTWADCFHPFAIVMWFCSRRDVPAVHLGSGSFYLGTRCPPDGRSRHREPRVGRRSVGGAPVLGGFRSMIVRSPWSGGPPRLRLVLFRIRPCLWWPSRRWLCHRLWWFGRPRGTRSHVQG
jgi:hypothetical protein